MEYGTTIKRRIKWAQRGLGIFTFLGIACYIAGWITWNSISVTMSLIFGVIALVFYCFLYYKKLLVRCSEDYSDQCRRHRRIDTFGNWAY